MSNFETYNILNSSFQFKKKNKFQLTKDLTYWRQKMINFPIAVFEQSKNHFHNKYSGLNSFFATCPPGPATQLELIALLNIMFARTDALNLPTKIGNSFVYHFMHIRGKVQ